MHAAAGSRGRARLFLPQFQLPLCFEEQGKKPFCTLRKLLQLLGSDLGEAEHRLLET